MHAPSAHSTNPEPVYHQHTFRSTSILWLIRQWLREAVIVDAVMEDVVIVDAEDVAALVDAVALLPAVGSLEVAVVLLEGEAVEGVFKEVEEDEAG